MKISVVLKPCPWCKKTPELCMPNSSWIVTWLWTVECHTMECTMKPKSKYVPLRKTTKRDTYQIAQKLRVLAERWNTGNDYEAYEMKVVDIDKVHA